MPLGVHNAIFTELMAFMLVVEITDNRGWFPMWFASDSEILLHKVLQKSDVVPLVIKTKWRNYLHILLAR